MLQHIRNDAELMLFLIHLTKAVFVAVNRNRAVDNYRH